MSGRPLSTYTPHCECGEHGSCESWLGKCVCQYGWTGEKCDKLLLPACSLARGAEEGRLEAALTYSDVEPQLAPSCGSIHRLSPVACECLLQCLRAGLEVRE